MPNIWTKTIQSFSEKFSGPRTNDIEIKKKYDEAVMMDKALKNLKNVIMNFTYRFEEIMNYNRQISESVIILYDNNEEYKEFGQVLNQVHLENNKLFKQITIEIHELNERTKDWPAYFSKVQDIYEEKEEIRKIYDHYEKKLEVLISAKEEKLKKGFCLNKGFSIKLERNEKKFLAAKEKYLNKCIDAFDIIENLLNDRFNLINQPLLNLFFIEMQLYENFSSKYKKYRGLEDKLSEMRKNFAQKDRKMRYDPTIFMKNPYLESKFIINREEKSELCKKSQEEHLNKLFKSSNNPQEQKFDPKPEKMILRHIHPKSDTFVIITPQNQLEVKVEDSHIHKQDINSFFNFELDDLKLDTNRQIVNEMKSYQDVDFANSVNSSNSSLNSQDGNISVTENLNLIFESNENENMPNTNAIILMDHFNVKKCQTDAQLIELNEYSRTPINLICDISENTVSEFNSDCDNEKKSKISYPSLKSILDQYNVEARNSYAVPSNNSCQNVFAFAKRNELSNSVVPYDYFDENNEKNIQPKVHNRIQPKLDDLFNDIQIIPNRRIMSKASTASLDPFAEFY